MVTIVVYLGVNQLILIADSKDIFTGNQTISSWVEEILEVKASNEFDSDLYIEVIDEYLELHNSPMAGSGAKYLEVAKKYDLPKYIMVAIAGAESNFGKSGYATQGTFNAVGLGIHEGRKYSSWDEGIEDMGYVLRNYYFDEGKDEVLEIQNKWAPRCVDNNACSNSWAENVDYFINEIQLIENSK